MGFTPSAGKELQSEYFVPRRHAVEAVLAVEKLHEQVGPHLLISEIRSIAGDNNWMSTCYKEPRVTIHFTWKQDWGAVSKLLPMIERELTPFDVRPHWGKLFTISPEKLRSSYERLPEFVECAGGTIPRENFVTTSSTEIFLLSRRNFSNIYERSHLLLVTHSAPGRVSIWL
jgi:xylitol oxidase